MQMVAVVREKRCGMRGRNMQPSKRSSYCKKLVIQSGMRAISGKQVGALQLCIVSIEHCDKDMRSCAQQLAEAQSGLYYTVLMYM
jgi:hypothetical protein